MVDSWAKRVFDSIRNDEVCRLALQLCAIPSPTGEEGKLAEFIVEWLRNHEIEGILQEVEPGRANAVGVLRGRDMGPSLMFNGHMDTGAPVRHEELTGPVPPRAPHIDPYSEDGILYGTGMDNMKSGLAAIMSAVRAIKAAGVVLKGDLIVAGVAGEVSRAPVDQYQGPYYRSKGIGTRYLLTHGIVSDYAIVADTSHFGLTWAQCGVIYAKISLPGKAAYTPFTRRSLDRRESENAIIKMTVLIEAFELWAAEYEEKNFYQSEAGEIRPKVNIGAIAGGAPFKVANSPLACSIYVDIRTPPGRRPIDVLRELRVFLDSLGLNCNLEVFTSQMGYEGHGVEPLVEAISESHEMVTGKSLPPIDPVENSMWTDTNLYNEVGIPAVKFGLGAALKPGPEGELHGMIRLRNSTSVEDLIRATKIYAAAALRICGVAQ